MSEILLLGIFHPQIGDFLALFRQIPLNLHAKIQKNIQKSDYMDGFCLQGELDFTLFYMIEGYFDNLKSLMTLMTVTLMTGIFGV